MIFIDNELEEEFSLSVRQVPWNRGFIKHSESVEKRWKKKKIYTKRERRFFSLLEYSTILFFPPLDTILDIFLAYIFTIRCDYSCKLKNNRRIGRERKKILLIYCQGKLIIPVRLCCKLIGESKLIAIFVSINTSTVNISNALPFIDLSNESRRRERKRVARVEIKKERGGGEGKRGKKNKNEARKLTLVTYLATRAC